MGWLKAINKVGPIGLKRVGSDVTQGTVNIVGKQPGGVNHLHERWCHYCFDWHKKGGLEFTFLMSVWSCEVMMPIICNVNLTSQHA